MESGYWLYGALLLLLLGIACQQVDGADNLLINSRVEVNVKVRNSFLSEVCTGNSSLLSVSYKSLSSEHSDRTVEYLCNSGAQGILLWVPEENFDGLATGDASVRYIGKSSADEDFIDYCSYDVTTQKCSTPDGAVDGSVMLLAEKYPERYELRDIAYKKWTNSTRLGSPILAYGSLKNREASYRYVDQDVSYLSDSRLEFLLPPTITHGLALSVYRGKTEAYKMVAGETHYSRVFKSINAVRHMSPYTNVNFTVTGTEERAYREFRAKLVIVYTDMDGFGWAKSLLSIEAASIETKLTETHVDYEPAVSLYESQDPVEVPTEVARPPGSKQSSKPIVAKPENIHIHINDVQLGQVYPGFRTTAICAAVLFFSVLGVALIDIVRRTVTNRRNKRLRGYSKANVY